MVSALTKPDQRPGGTLYLLMSDWVDRITAHADCLPKLGFHVHVGSVMTYLPLRCKSTKPTVEIHTNARQHLIQASEWLARLERNHVNRRWETLGGPPCEIVYPFIRLKGAANLRRR